MARGDVRAASSLLELAVRRGRDATTLLRLATVYRALGDYSQAVKVAAAAVELEPRNFLMCLLLGSLHEVMGAPHAAQRAYKAACAFGPKDLSFQPALRKQFDHAQRCTQAGERWRRDVFAWLPPEDLSELEKRRLLGFRDRLLEEMDKGPLASPKLMIPQIPPATYLSNENFAGVGVVEAATAAIRDEYLALVSKRSDVEAGLGGAHGSDGHASATDLWSMIPLMRNGRTIDEFARRCPVTMDVVRQLDLAHLPLISPSLYFSVLGPGSRIAPHTGLTNARLIVHFPLIVPDRCGFRVGEEARPWRVGEALIFDDMTIHEAWNESDAMRVVLIADLWRPELSQAERAVVQELLNCRLTG